MLLQIHSNANKGISRSKGLTISSNEDNILNSFLNIISNNIINEIFSLKGNITAYTSYKIKGDIVKKNKAVQAIDRISDLVDNWDGEGAGRFDPVFIKSIRQIVQQLAFEPEVFPTAANSIQLEYRKDGNYLEFEILENLSVEVLMVKHHTTTANTIDDIKVKQLNEYLGKFYDLC